VSKAIETSWNGYSGTLVVEDWEVGEVVAWVVVDRDEEVVVVDVVVDDVDGVVVEVCNVVLEVVVVVLLVMDIV